MENQKQRSSLIANRLAICLVLFMSSFSSAFGFSSISLFKSCYVLSSDFTYQKEHFAGISGGVGIDNDGLAQIRAGAQRSLDSSFKGVNFGFEIIGIGSESTRRDFPYIAFGADFTHSWGYGEKELRFVPRIGVSFRSYVSLTYRYGLHISGDHIKDIGNHGIALGINIPFAID